MLALLLATTGPASAATYEDGLAAYSRRDYALAVRLWQQVAEMGDARAQWFLGFAYQWNYGVAKDDTVAARWYRKAAEQGYALAQHTLGMMYYDGAGIEQDTAEATKWLQSAAIQGFGESQLVLAQIYRDGYGVARDLAKAYLWFDIAARQGVLGAAEGRDETARKMPPDQLAEARQLAAEWMKLHP